jgi:hypothetical protein
VEGPVIRPVQTAKQVPDYLQYLLIGDFSCSSSLTNWKYGQAWQIIRFD